MRQAWIGWSCVIALLLARPAPGDEPLRRTISVTGQGKAAAPPDMATIYTGVVTHAPAATDALEENTKAMDRILALLKSHRIASKDVQTSNFNVRPEYKRDPRGRTRPQIIGYRVTNQVRVRVRNLPDLGEILDALVQAGSNEISGISFAIDDPTGLLNEARNKAITDARSRAGVYAQAAGVRRGKVLTISEQPVQIPRPQYFARGMEAAGAAVPVATGEQQVQVTVQVVFALEDMD